MQQNKVIEKLQETVKYSTDSNILLKTFASVIGEFRLTGINSVLNKAKAKGVLGQNIFKTLFIFVFIDLKNVSQLMASGFSVNLTHEKDVFYEFMKNEHIDWRKILTSFSKQFVRITQKKGDAQAESKANKGGELIKLTPKCIIVDDTLLPKRGKTIEFIGKVFDHCDRSCKIGIKILTLIYWDGKSIIPIDFSQHNEPGKKKNRGLKQKDLEAQFVKERQIDSPGHKRAQEVSIDKITMAVNMIKNAIKNSFEPLYVLGDSWFINETFITEIEKIKVKYAKKLFVIGLMKTDRFVVINGKKLKANTVPDHKMKDIHYCKSLKCNYIASKITYKGIELKAFWVKMKGQETWKMLISTDVSLSFITAMKYYHIRWSIEVFFKECKQNMGLNKCQSTDFDAYTATITLCFINYMILAMRKRFDDYETFGEIFREFKSQLLEANLVEKIWALIMELYVEIFAEMGVDLESFVEMLINKQEKIENFIKHSFQFLFSGSKQVA
jgi:Transposase DDE domain